MPLMSKAMTYNIPAGSKYLPAGRRGARARVLWLSRRLFRPGEVSTNARSTRRSAIFFGLCRSKLRCA
jgi:hypothetical protein